MDATTNEHYEFLDMLRETGQINMFGAGSHLMDQFDLTKYEANRILLSWMETYEDRKGK